MKYVSLGSTDLKVSQLGLGGFNFGTVTDEKTAMELMDCYIEYGGNVALFTSANVEHLKRNMKYDVFFR